MKTKIYSMAILSILTLTTYAQDKNSANTPEPKPIINPTKIRNYTASNPIPHTSIKNQGYVGFCWSYSGMGLIESEYKKRTGLDIDLNEEYIGFFHVYNQILKGADYFWNNPEKVYQKTGKGFKDAKGNLKTNLKNVVNYYLTNLLQGTKEGAPDLQLVLDLAKTYGVVPESSFKYKITKEQGDSVKNRIMGFVHEKLRNLEIREEYYLMNGDGSVQKDGKGQAKLDQKKVLEELARVYTQENNGTDGGDGNCDSCDLIESAKSIQINGQLMSPKQYLNNILKVDLNNFSEIKVGRDNFSKAIAQMEKSIDQGIAVQMGVFLLSGYSDAVKGEGKLMPENCGKYTACKVEGGHAILAINKVTDETGKMTGIIIKNSWGPYGLDSVGTKNGDLGYQIIFIDYLSKLFDITEKKDSDGKITTSQWWMHIPNSAK